jgi:hypothetical protein
MRGKLGRYRCRWEGNIKMDLKELEWERVGWIQRARDRGQWWVLVNTVMKLPVPYNADNLLTSWETISFSRSPLLHAVAVYTTSLTTCQILLCRIFETLPNNEFEIMWQELVVAYLEIISRKVPGGTEEYHQNIQDSLCPPAEIRICFPAIRRQASLPLGRKMILKWLLKMLQIVN